MSQGVAIVVTEGKKVVRVIACPRGAIERVLLHPADTFTPKAAAEVLGRSKTLIIELVRKGDIAATWHQGGETKKTYDISRGALLRYLLAHYQGAVREEHLTALLALVPYLTATALETLRVAIEARAKMLTKMPEVGGWVSDAEREQLQLSL